ncbi:hypothetical protein D0X99_07865 [Algoriphagus lacus]|uniref:Uncharacterized protein n=1 Tax=Algoriphagus lacus TaxID=2056311 RepID=A0A418PT56_9BACT|nr:hypothetical protein [Algoriphagus lacus]RIW16274.1 hypothetical protein D0X99_07865 [Algoriphagus lacus]
MKERIKELLDKYWDAETTLEEEKELRDLLRNSEGFEQEKSLFKALENFQAEEPQHLTLPDSKLRKLNPRWISWAASVAILVGSFWSWRVYEQKQAEKEAYEEVMEALALIQTNLSKGQEQMEPLKDLKYLNTTNQLFQLNKPTKQ